MFLHWVPRFQQREADKLSNEVFASFDPARRVKLTIEEIKWIILPEIISLGHELFEDLEVAKTERRKERTLAAPTAGAGPSGGKRRKRKRAGLKETDPW